MPSAAVHAGNYSKANEESLIPSAAAAAEYILRKRSIKPRPATCYLYSILTNQFGMFFVDFFIVLCSFFAFNNTITRILCLSVYLPSVF